MELSEKKDLLLAKRRISAIFPFLIINLFLSIFMTMLTATSYSKIDDINDEYWLRDYYLQPDNYINIDFCNNYKRESISMNFSIFFRMHSKDEKTMENLDDAIAGCIGVSAICFFFLLILSGLGGYYYYKYVYPSDDTLKENPEYFPNKRHPKTTCFCIFKGILFLWLDVFLFIYLIIADSINEDFFDDVYNFHDYCLKERAKEKFREEYTYCWEIEGPLDFFTACSFFFLFFDLMSIAFFSLSKNYNVWSYIRYKITCGKYPYKEIDFLPGFIVPQNQVVQDNKSPDQDNQITQQILDKNNQYQNEFIGPINSEDDEKS